MAGRAGNPTTTRQFDHIVYMPCTAENNFVPALPSAKVDLIYLCYPNNPTGAVATKEQLKKSIVLVTLFIILVASRAYPETLFWDNFNEKLEVKMNNRLIFNFDDYFRPPRLNLNDGSYTMMQMEALKEIEDIIGEDIEGSLLFALEKEWRQKREKSPKIRGLSKIGINKKTREIELRIENLKEELRDIKESGRTKDIKRAWELKNQIREKQKRLAEEKLIELGIDTSFDIRKFSEWNVSVAPFFEKSFGPVINKASFVYLL